MRCTDWSKTSARVFSFGFGFCLGIKIVVLVESHPSRSCSYPFLNFGAGTNADICKR